jgi:GT2 family glycosyltransferase
MKVYVIVVTFNASRWVKPCLESIEASSIPVQLLVIDNASTDDTVTLAQTNFPTAKIITNRYNSGFGRANNQGIQYALKGNADFIFLLNQDARIEKITIKNLIATSSRHPDYAVLSPIHLNGDATKLDYNFSIYASPEHCRNFFSDVLLKGNDLNEVYKIDFVNAAFWMVPSRFFYEIGGFDPVFQHYGEDGDWINRVRFHGYTVGICTNAIGFHDREQQPFNYQNLHFQKKLERTRSRYLLLLKNVNHNFFKSLLYTLKEFVKDNYKAITSFNFKSLLLLYVVLLEILINIVPIIRHRQICKQKGPHFLIEKE